MRNCALSVCSLPPPGAPSALSRFAAGREVNHSERRTFVAISANERDQAAAMPKRHRPPRRPNRGLIDSRLLCRKFPQRSDKRLRNCLWTNGSSNYCSGATRSDLKKLGSSCGLHRSAAWRHACKSKFLGSLFLLKFRNRSNHDHGLQTPDMVVQHRRGRPLRHEPAVTSVATSRPAHQPSRV